MDEDEAGETGLETGELRGPGLEDSDGITDDEAGVLLGDGNDTGAEDGTLDGAELAGEELMTGLEGRVV